MVTISLHAQLCRAAPAEHAGAYDVTSLLLVKLHTVGSLTLDCALSAGLMPCCTTTMSTMMRTCQAAGPAAAVGHMLLCLACAVC